MKLTFENNSYCILPNKIFTLFNFCDKMFTLFNFCDKIFTLFNFCDKIFALFNFCDKIFTLFNFCDKQDLTNILFFPMLSNVQSCTLLFFTNK